MQRWRVENRTSPRDFWLSSPSSSADPSTCATQGSKAADDVAMWEYAKAGGFAIVSKDADLRQSSFLYGSPPKVVWLRVGNRSTAEIEAIVRANVGDLKAFNADPVASMLGRASVREDPLVRPVSPGSP